MRRVLTEAFVVALRQPRQGRLEVADLACPGLIVRCTPTGHKTWMLRTRIGRNPTRREIGRVGNMPLEEARATCREWLRLIEAGVDPKHHRPRRERQLRFGEAVEDWLQRRVSHHRQRETTIRTVRRELLSVWRDRPLGSITRTDVVELVERIAARPAPSIAHMAFAHLSSFCGWAIQKGWLEHSPCERVNTTRLIGPRRVRQRVLDDTELAVFWLATERLEVRWRVFYRLVALTGCRKMEVGGLRWAEVNSDTRCLTIPPERFKADREHLVPLSDAAWAELQRVPREREYVFSADGGRHPWNCYAQGKRRLDREMARVLGRPVEPFIVHDLRRTARTRLAQLGVPWEVCELAIGHSLGGLNRIYNLHRYCAEVREAWQAYSEHIEELAERHRAAEMGDAAAPMGYGAARDERT